MSKTKSINYKLPKREIILTDSIDDSAVASVFAQLSELERSPGDIYISLCSAGGDAYSALAIASRLEQSPNTIIVTGYGFVASAAVIILAYGDERRLTKESWVMVHEDSGKIRGDTTSIASEAKHWEEMEAQWSYLLSTKSLIPASDWLSLHRKTSYLNPAQCLDYGLIERVI